MPMIRRGDDDGVNVFARAQLAEVVVDGLFVNACALAGQPFALFVNVADGDRLYIASLFGAVDDMVNVRVHPPATADEAYVDAVVGADDAPLGENVAGF